MSYHVIRQLLVLLLLSTRLLVLLLSLRAFLVIQSRLVGILRTLVSCGAHRSIGGSCVFGRIELIIIQLSVCLSVCLPVCLSYVCLNQNCEETFENPLSHPLPSITSITYAIDRFQLLRIASRNKTLVLSSEKDLVSNQAKTNQLRTNQTLKGKNELRQLDLN